MGPKRKRSRRSTTTSSVYNREDADLELSSNDNTIFKVDSFYLKAHSEVFRNMFTDQLFTNSAIPIDLSSKDLTCLLDIMIPNLGIRSYWQEHKDVDLARYAIESIAKFKDKHLISAGNMPLSMAETIDLPFLLPLLEQVQVHSAQIYTMENRYTEGQVREIWAKIAKDPQPRE
ncbi:uncharacterized protein L199_007750 [Kwoniella botswanensis]|uniref:uncharacterized protein n=1 Tax=Kwoniella botswanensis TaxID=1268659 RepID=UPI00315CCAD5